MSTIVFIQRLKYLLPLLLILIDSDHINAQTLVNMRIRQSEQLIINLSEYVYSDSATVLPGNNLVVTGGSAPFNYTWSVNGNIVSAESNPEFSYEEGTVYTLEVSDANGCIVSNTVTLGIVNLESVTTDNVRVYPVPSRSNICIELPNKHSGFTIRLLDINGKLLYSEFSLENRIEINLNNVNGIYFLELFNESNKVIKKIIISQD
jgi:hypothetical protein